MRVKFPTTVLTNDARNGYIDDVRGWDFVSNDNNPMDGNFDGHGTHVEGAIAAEQNDFGITGVAYNAKIMPVRVLPTFGYGKGNNIAAGIRYAAENGANVINYSLGGCFLAGRLMRQFSTQLTKELLS